MQDIKIIKAKTVQEKPDPINLGFGKYHTDYMFTMDYSEGKGWHNYQIQPYNGIVLDPGCIVLHYAQETFEGLKAFRTDDGRILLFRPDMHAKRFNKSNIRLCMPQVPENDFIELVRRMVLFEQDWIPKEDKTALYVRPFMFGVEEAIGARPSKDYKFVILLSPVGNYFQSGFNPLKIYVEDVYSRTAKGGIGSAKTGGNYAASIFTQDMAKKKGYAQVMWLDSIEHKYVEEVGAMNVMFKINGEIITPPLSDTILAGVTRDTCITILKSWGLNVVERNISMDELMSANEEGILEEVFGTGTGVVIAPIGELCYKEKILTIGGGKTGSLTQRLYDYLCALQRGKVEDNYNWTWEIK